MKLNEKYYVIEKMSLLIEHGITGNSYEFAEKLGISRSQLFIEFDEIKSLGVGIKYDRSRRTFIFSGDKKVKVRKPLVIVENEEFAYVNGGCFDKISSVLFSGRCSFNLAVENFQV